LFEVEDLGGGENGLLGKGGGCLSKASCRGGCVFGPKGR